MLERVDGCGVAREEPPTTRHHLVAEQRRGVIEDDEIDVVAVELFDSDGTEAQLIVQADPLAEEHSEIDVAVWACRPAAVEPNR